MMKAMRKTSNREGFGSGSWASLYRPIDHPIIASRKKYMPHGVLSLLAAACHGT